MLKRLFAALLLVLSVPAVAQVPPTTLGINLTGLEYFANTRTFSNLMAGGLWTLVKADQGWYSMPGDYLDANRNVVGLKAGEQAARQMSVPTAAFRGQAVPIVCRWDGTGTVWITGSVRDDRVITANGAIFTYDPAIKQGNATLLLRNMPAGNVIRNIDCREKSADPAALFDPTYLAEVKRYSTIRFLKWTRAADEVLPVTWATRTKPSDAIYNGADSVAIEHMVALANLTKTNPWFIMPWNADADYVRRAATLVRDTLDPSLKAYVENANEVWNGVLPVTWQAREEGKKAALPNTILDFDATLTRYAAKTGEVMDIWASVYAGQMHRLVRVGATRRAYCRYAELLEQQAAARQVPQNAAPVLSDGRKKGPAPFVAII
jgi:hypothetical protein